MERTARSIRSAAAVDDAQLLAAARRGDHRAFRSIMERNNRRLYRVARALLKDDADAEEVVQESYLRAFAALPSFRGEASLATWLTRIVLNEALGRKRKTKATVELTAVEAMQERPGQIIWFPLMNPDANPERAVAQREIRKLLETAIDGLPEPFRLVFVMRDVEEMSIEETARLLSIRPETVKTRLHRARRLLREALDQRLASTLKDSFPFAGARCARITDTVLSRIGASS
jgi:RNA polymerase sigma-70 factor, ECF subfamily